MEISPGFKWVSFKQNDTLLHKVFIKSFLKVLENPAFLMCTSFIYHFPAYFHLNFHHTVE